MFCCCCICLFAPSRLVLICDTIIWGTVFYSSLLITFSLINLPDGTKIQVKLEEVDVSNGEEEEEVLCSYRSKLFLYGETLLDVGTGKKTWKERGIGEARILRHREHQRLRFLMRQEKTMKVIANHALDPRIKLEPNAGSDRSWVWSCYDFADGELEEKVFALRFANTEVADDFKGKYEEHQKEMEALLAGEDKADESGKVDEAAEALSGLKTGDDA